MTNYEDDDIDDEVEDNEPTDEEAAGAAPASNRNFILALGIMGGIFILILIALFVFWLSTRGQGGGQTADINATNQVIMTANAETAMAATQVAGILLTPSVTPTASETPMPATATKTLVVALPAATITPAPGAGAAGSGFSDAELDAAVKAGTMTQAQADEFKGLNALAKDSTFQAAMKAAYEAALKQAVSGGVITQAQGDAILQPQSQTQADETKGLNALATDSAFQAAIQAAYEAALKQAVSGGVITQAQGNAIQQRQPQVSGFLGGGGVPTVTPNLQTRTATIQAVLTQNAQQTQTQVVKARLTGTATALPKTGFAEDVGLPGLFGLAAGLVLVIVLVRRMRLSPNG